MLRGYVWNDDTCGDGDNAFLQKNDSVINVKVEISEDDGKVPLDYIAKRAERASYL